MSHKHIVKRRSGHTESYDNHKVYASCYAACLASHIAKEKAEDICGNVMREIDKWIDDKENLSSQDIFEHIAQVMRQYDEDAAFMYATHRDVS